MRARGREFVAANESTVVTKPLLDPVVVENGQGDRSLADSASTDEGDWGEVLSEIDYLLDQLVASKERPRWQRWGFSRYAAFKCKTTGLPTVQIADLVRVCATMSRSSVTAISVRVSLTSRLLLPSTPWSFMTVRWISETMVRVLVVLRSSSETMARKSRRMSETVPCALPGEGCDDSPGALDAGVRCWFCFQLRPLTWRESGKGWMVTRWQVGYKRHPPSDSGCANPPAFSTRYDDCRKQRQRSSQRHSERWER